MPTSTSRWPSGGPDGRIALRGIDSERARRASATVGRATATRPLSAIPHATASIPSASIRATMMPSPTTLAAMYETAAVTT